MGNELGDLIRRKRKAKGWTQAQLAEKVDTRQVTVSDWERGRNDPSNLGVVASVLGISQEEIYLAMAGGLYDDPVVKALMASQRVNAEVRNALLTIYEVAVQAHKQSNKQEGRR